MYLRLQAALLLCGSMSGALPFTAAAYLAVCLVWLNAALGLAKTMGAAEEEKVVSVPASRCLPLLSYYFRHHNELIGTASKHTSGSLVAWVDTGPLVVHHCTPRVSHHALTSATLATLYSDTRSHTCLCTHPQQQMLTPCYAAVRTPCRSWPALTARHCCSPQRPAHCCCQPWLAMALALACPSQPPLLPATRQSWRRR